MRLDGEWGNADVRSTGQRKAGFEQERAFLSVSNEELILPEASLSVEAVSVTS